MANDYIPTRVSDYMVWETNLTLKMDTTYGTVLGFSAGEIADLNADRLALSNAILDNETKQTAARAATQALKDQLAASKALMRATAQRAIRHPAMTNAIRADLGLTIPDTEPTPFVPPPLEIPNLVVDFSVRRTVTVHWGPNPGDERHNARPTGTIGCRLQYAVGGIPASESGWIDLPVDTASPLIHKVENDQPATLAYRGQYVGRDLSFGPPCDPMVCTVTP